MPFSRRQLGRLPGNPPSELTLLLSVESFEGAEADGVPIGYA